MAVRLDKYRPVVTLISGSVAVEFEHPRFITVFNALFDRFTSKPVVMLMSDGVAVGLENPRFMTAFDALFDRVKTKQVATLMSNSVTARRGPLLHDHLQRPVRQVTSKPGVTLMSNNFRPGSRTCASGRPSPRCATSEAHGRTRGHAHER